MLRWFRSRRLSEAARRRLALALARAEEKLVDTHARNVLDVYDAVGGEIPLTRVLDVYFDSVGEGEPRASIVARRVLARGERARTRRRPSRAE